MHLITYGSLMNKKEFEGKNPKLIEVKGYKRLFNKIASRQHWRKYAKGKEKAALNAVKDKDSHFNAVSYEIDEKEFKKLLKREEDYHHEEAETYDFYTKEYLGKYILFVSNKINKEGRKATDNNILPIKEYLKICRIGAYSWGKEFGKGFDKSTFLADRKTKIIEYQKN